MRLFAALRERAGRDVVELDLPEGALVADALQRLETVTNGVPVVMAVNHEYADADASLHEGDEVALIPPVSGGSVGALHVRVTDQPLELEPLIERVRDPRAGAVVTFLGMTREVSELRYEAYAEMAERQMAEIVARAVERYALCAAAAEHRVGTVPLSEASVSVAASAPHREAAFAGAREIIDEIKARVPVCPARPSRPPEAEARLSELPAVHEVAARLDAPHHLAVAAARRAIEEHRASVLNGKPAPGPVDDRARELLAELERPSLRRVINATGVVLHTNLGRAPLAAEARRAVAEAAGYVNLEYQLATSERGSRHAHVDDLLCELTGAEAAMVVNNGAAAVLLAVAALTGPDQSVVVSRGQLVEIGGGFRIPEVIGQSGARLVEVGTTNRTRLADYQRALAAEENPTILRVHQSNFRTVGFVEEVTIDELSRLGAPVIDDVGSGVLTDAPALRDEPSLQRSVLAGAAIVCSSADKLLGGPQAGLMVGSAKAIAAARQHPLARALRIDKLSLAGLEATLRIYREPERALTAVPALAMLAAGEAELQRRAETLRAGIGPQAEVTRASARTGGGSLPLLELEGPVVALPESAGADRLAAALRWADPPVIARIRDGRVLLDPRTLTDSEVDEVARAVRTALGQQ